MGCFRRCLFTCMCVVLLSSCREISGTKREKPVAQNHEQNSKVLRAISRALAKPRSKRRVDNLRECLALVERSENKELLIAAVAVGYRLNDCKSSYKKSGSRLKRDFPVSTHLNAIGTSNLSATCSACEGQGKSTKESQCHMCGGYGLCRISNCVRGHRIPYIYIKTNINMREGVFNRTVDEKECSRFFSSRYRCEDCKGRGKCKSCHGSGKCHESQRCTSCRGKGKRPCKDRMETVYIELLTTLRNAL